MNAMKTLGGEVRMPDEAAAKAAARKQNLHTIIQVVGMLPVLILICIGFEFATGKFLSGKNISIVMQQASINIVLATGLTFVILTGGIDLAVGSVLAVSAVTAVSMSLGAASALAIPCGLLVGLVLGALNGSLIAFFRLPAFIVTLGAMTAVRGLSRLAAHDTTVFNAALPFSWGSSWVSGCWRRSARGATIGPMFDGRLWLSSMAFGCCNGRHRPSAGTDHDFAADDHSDVPDR